MSSKAAMIDAICSYIDSITEIKQAKRRQCKECARIGARWVQLRTCQERDFTAGRGCPPVLWTIASAGCLNGARLDTDRRDLHNSSRFYPPERRYGI